MQAKDSCFTAVGNDFQERMFGTRRIMPFVMGDLNPTDESYRVRTLSRAVRSSRVSCQALDHQRIGCFLENDQVGLDCANHLCQSSFATSASKADVVAQECQIQDST